MSRSNAAWILPVLLLAGLALLVVAMLRPLPDAATQTPEAALRVVASRRFQDLAPEEQNAYVNQAFATGAVQGAEGPNPKESLSPRQLQSLHHNLGVYKAGTWVGRVEAYHAMPRKEQVAYLDGLIDQELRDKAESRPGKKDGGALAKTTAKVNEASKPSEKGNGKAPGTWLKESIESSTPEQRARSLEFKRALRERRQQRGLPDW